MLGTCINQVCYTQNSLLLYLKKKSGFCEQGKAKKYSSSVWPEHEWAGSLHGKHVCSRIEQHCWHTSNLQNMVQMLWTELYTCQMLVLWYGCRHT